MLTPWQTGFESWSCVSVLSNKGKLGTNASLSWRIWGEKMSLIAAYCMFAIYRSTL